MKSKKIKTVVRTRGSTRGKILTMIRTQRTVGGGDLTRELGVTRQALNLHIRSMLQERLIWKEGVTRAAVYHPGPGPEKKASPAKAKPVAAKAKVGLAKARLAPKPAPAPRKPKPAHKPVSVRGKKAAPKAPAARVRRR